MSESDFISGRSQKKKRLDTADAVILEEAIHRTERASDHLRSKLRGRLKITVSDTGEYIFDWSENRAHAYKLDGNDSPEVDASITLSEETLVRIAEGSLNPQICLLSEKINIEGSPELPIYFFNLITPT
ncbi:MAG: hypothetical protein D6808_08255 [Candidatus Dadabacteria bacterium]|nr:MAG: hypothetical protein D6808_08255 [Candidatus Dadabacteria bacterium]